MCGFVSVVDWDQPLSQNDRARLALANQRIIARGPDSSGNWESPCGHYAGAHRRLSIIDLSAAGHQPMNDCSGRYTIVFNGEIYNFRHLKNQLIPQGYKFSSDSDTEVIMAAYDHWGPQCVTKFRGMFAFCIWDHHKSKLYIARDGFGIKPLYAMREGSKIWFGSQVRALARIAQQLTEDDTARAGFLLWGSIPEPWTPFKEIRAVPAGSWLELTASIARNNSDLNFIQYEPDASAMRNCSIPEQAESFAELVRDTVEAHCIADVPVGVFLSAGKDSTTLAALVCERPKQTEPVRTVTLGFREFEGTELDEVPAAESVARHLRTDHTTIWTSRRDFLDDLEAIFFAMDQPSQDGINTYFVSKAAKLAGLKVVLSGLGGDELLGGYPSFSQVPQWARIPSALRPIGTGIRAMLQRLNGLNPKTKSALEYSGTYEHGYLLRRTLFLPWEIADHMGHDRAKSALMNLASLEQLKITHKNELDSFSKISCLEAKWYMKHQLLRDSDWASMAHSLELRVPLVDPVLWQLTRKLRQSHQSPTKQSLVLTPKNPLPQNIIQRPKSGFATPVARWLAESAESAQPHQRGLRAWATHVYDRWLESTHAERCA